MTDKRGRGPGRQMAESQLSELQNARVLLEEARGLSRNLAYHPRAWLEARIGEALDEVAPLGPQLPHLAVQYRCVAKPSRLLSRGPDVGFESLPL